MKFRRNIDPKESLCIGAAALLRLLRKIGEIHVSYLTKQKEYIFLTRMRNLELYRRGSGNILNGIKRNIKMAANQHKIIYKELNLELIFFVNNKDKNKSSSQSQYQDQLSDYVHEYLRINIKNENS